MLPPSDPLPQELGDAFAAVRPRLGRLGTSWRYYATVGSTNDVAVALAAGAGDRAAAEGAVVIADAQTAGRGRRGRTWFSPQGSGLYLSTILMPGRASSSPERATSLADARRRRGARRGHRARDRPGGAESSGPTISSSVAGSSPASWPKASPPIGPAPSGMWCWGTASTWAACRCRWNCWSERRPSRPNWGARLIAPP